MNHLKPCENITWPDKLAVSKLTFYHEFDSVSHPILNQFQVFWMKKTKKQGKLDYYHSKAAAPGRHT